MDRSQNGMRVVESGIEADDRVIVNGLLRVRAGDKVSPHTDEKDIASGLACQCAEIGKSRSRASEDELAPFTLFR